LKYILHSLCRSRVPTPPLQAFITDTATTSPPYCYSIIYTDVNWKAQCKLAHFSPVTTHSTTPTSVPNNTTVYNVEIRRNGNVGVLSPIMNCTVQISNTRYPAIVPTWNFLNNTSTLNTMGTRNNNNNNNENDDVVEHRYDTHMAQLAHRVNVEILDLIPILSETSPRRPTVMTDQYHEESIHVLQFCEWILIHQIREIMHFVDSIPENDHNHSDVIDYPLYKGKDRQIR
jgi:uncharacterized protein (DUF608 family)